MNLTVMFSLLSTVTLTIALVILVKNRQSSNLSMSVFTPLFISILLYNFIVASNLLEHSGITDFFDPLEDIAEIVFTLIFLFFANNWRKNLSEARFRVLFKQAPSLLAEISKNGRIIEVNDMLSRKIRDFYGITTNAIPTLNELLHFAYPEPAQRKKIISIWQQKIDQAFASGAALKPEEIEIACGDGTKRSMIIGASIIGENFLISMVDVTDQKQAEQVQEDLRTQLRQAQKMESIGTLAGGIAHDFNNILSAIIGYTEIAKEFVDKNSPVDSSLTGVLKASARAADLVRQILTFSRQTEAEQIPFKMDSVVKEAVKMLRSSIPVTIEIIADISPGMILADPTQIHQVVMNLCTNAYHAMQDKGGVLGVSLRPFELDPVIASLHPEMNTLRVMRLRVTDTGHGMQKSTLDRIFDPYFSTKEKGQGTGLGLSVVHGIVKNHGGFVTVESQPEKGSCFEVYLPMIEEKKEGNFRSRAEAPLPKGNERILFVDDEPALAEIGKHLLTRLGYQAVIETSSLDALALFRKSPDAFDMVITDMSMPRMSGHELSQALLEIRKDIPIILCSGFSEPSVVEKSNKIGIRKVLHKPLLLKKLSKAVRDVLDQME